MARYFLSRLSPSLANLGNRFVLAWWFTFQRLVYPRRHLRKIIHDGTPSRRGIRFQVNLNLLAHVRCDTVPGPDGGRVHVAPSAVPDSPRGAGRSEL
jgi:hypothetical protein